MTSAFLAQPVRHKSEAMIALACRACGLDPVRLGQVDADPQVLQARQLAAWLMRVRAEIPAADVAAALGVEIQFVNATVFTVRRRLASGGVRIDAPEFDVAIAVRDLLAPAPAALLDEALPLSDCFMAIVLGFGLSRAELTSLGRQHRPTRARHCFCWLASIASTAEPKQIGRWINRGRTSVGYGVDRIAALPGAAALRDEILVALGRGLPTEAELITTGQRLELITRPQPSQPEG